MLSLTLLCQPPAELVVCAGGVRDQENCRNNLHCQLPDDVHADILDPLGSHTQTHTVSIEGRNALSSLEDG